MKNLTDQLAQYATYHRDRRNIATHLVGIQMILLALQVLLSRPVLADAGVPVTPALILTAITALYYLRLDRPLGALMALLMAAGLALAWPLASQSTPLWLWSGLGLFVLGWVIQFVGHFWEGRKPAFADDLMGLVIGPLFVVAEVVFALGGRRALHDAITARAGPLRSGSTVASQPSAGTKTL